MKLSFNARADVHTPNRLQFCWQPSLSRAISTEAGKQAHCKLVAHTVFKRLAPTPCRARAYKVRYPSARDCHAHTIRKRPAPTLCRARACTLECHLARFCRARLATRIINALAHASHLPAHAIVTRSSHPKRCCKLPSKQTSACGLKSPICCSASPADAANSGPPGRLVVANAHAVLADPEARPV